MNFHDIGKSSPYTTHLEGVVIDRDLFRNKIEKLTSQYDVVPFSKLIENPFNPRLAAVTFDDGYRGVLTEALKVMEEYRCPFKVFLNEDQVNGQISWINKLSFLFSNKNQAEVLELARAFMPNHQTMHPGKIQEYRRFFEFPHTIEAIEREFSKMSEPVPQDLFLNVRDVRSLIDHPQPTAKDI